LEDILSEDKKYGFIKVNRKYFESDYWQEKRVFSRAEAWLDLIQLARWQQQSSGRQFIKSLSKHVEWQRGQIIGSIRFLSKRWDWSRGKVENFLADLKKREMVVIDVSDGIQRITLTNYERYNDMENDRSAIIESKNEDKGEDSPEDGFKDTSKDTETTKLYEVKSGSTTGLKTEAESLVKTGSKTKQKEIITKKKEEKIYVAEKVSLSKSELEKLYNKYGTDKTAKLIEKLNAYKLSNPKKIYASDYGAIENWVVKAVLEEEVLANRLKNEKNRGGNYRGKGAIDKEMFNELRRAAIIEHGYFDASNCPPYLRDLLDED